MNSLSGKHIVLGVTAGIAAYKTAYLVRLLVKSGAEVQVVMTPDAAEFVTPLTLSTLSKKPVYVDLIHRSASTVSWNNHVEIAQWADLLIIAPATANTMAKMVSGQCDNLLMAVYMSAKKPVMFAPAMDLDMYQHPSTKNNISRLQSFGNILIPAESGELASGLTGEGRMAEPETIFRHIENHFCAGKPLAGKKITITAGPTYEPIDPVRFIGNHSSGKMGFELAEVAAEKGAEVTLVSGPTNLQPENTSIHWVRVQTAQEMFDACEKTFATTDVFIASAAVADYKPKHKAEQKIKKSAGTMQIELEKNPDILATLGQQKTHQLVIGFALETENELENAQQKLQKKNADLIVLNSLNDSGAGFGTDTNKVTFVFKNKQAESLPLMSKTKVAEAIIEQIITHYE